LVPPPVPVVHVVPSTFEITIILFFLVTHVQGQFSFSTSSTDTLKNIKPSKVL
jgi:hypothetical protein